MAGELAVMCSGAFIGILDQLLPTMQASTGKSVRAISGSSIGTTPRAIPVRLRGGEAADLVILFDQTIDQLIKEGLVARGTKVRLASSGIGMAVKSGSPRPDISSSGALGRALLAASSFAYSASASGLYVSSDMLRKLDLPEEVGRKGFRVLGEPVGAVVARGAADLGFQQMSELLAIEGLDVVGPLPADVQQLSILSAGIPSTSTDAAGARALVDYILSEAVRPVLTEAGLGVDVSDKWD